MAESHKKKAKCRSGTMASKLNRRGLITPVGTNPEKCTAELIESLKSKDKQMQTTICS
jgi:hypothetical protein